jgi:putative phosphoesterase
MNVGLLSDIHGNQVALDAVLADMPAVDALVCAGDVVGYNPWPAECVAWVRENAVPTVMGNHDRAVAGDDGFAFNSQAGAGVRYAREHLSEDDIAWLGSLPDQRCELDGRLKIVHGHPDDPDRYTFPEDFSPDLLGEEDGLVLGHTHLQHHEIFEEGVVVNPGSVGQPRDGDPRAAYAVLDLDELSVEEHRVAYDVGDVMTAVEDADLPADIGRRLRRGR